MSFVKKLALKMFFGKYSHTYQNYVINSKQNQAKNISYLNPCSKLDALNHYRPVVDENKKIVEFVTSKKIEFQNIPFNTSFRIVKKRNRKPSCYDIQKYQDHYWRRLGYRERIFNTGVRMIYHFLNNRFFFGEIFFSDSSKVNPEIVALSLLKKYSDQKEVPKTNFKITSKNTFIFFENTGINLSIKYVYTGNETINSTLKALDNFSPFAKAEQTDDLDDIL